MTRALPAYRYILCVIITIVVVACRRSTDDVPFQVVDLVREFDRAEKRPSAGFQTTAYTVAGVVRPAIVVPVPSRVIWSLPLPRHGRFRAFLALSDRADPSAAIRFRFGVSDFRIYEGLAQQTITAGQRGWVDFRTDLSAYAGFKWSLFYRPDRVTWRVVLATDVVEGGPAAAVWGSPEIVTDVPAAKEYIARRHRLR
jgi:hypothetical protein